VQTPYTPAKFDLDGADYLDLDPYTEDFEAFDLSAAFSPSLRPAARFVEDALADLEDDIDYSVIGPRDDRFQIRARPNRPSTLLFPFNTICLLEILNAAGSVVGTGSGTLIAPQVVLTAKHVLMNVNPPRCAVGRSLGSRFTQIRVTPGADFSAADPRQRRPATPSSLIANQNRFRVDPNLDYGVIVLPRPFQGFRQFMMLQPRSAQNTATLLTIAGYPCDKPLGTMWGHSDRIELRNITATHLSYTIDTCPGHSGSPIWLLGNNDIRLLLGIHTSGVPATAGRRCENDPLLRNCRRTGAPVTPIAGLNCGVRITCGVINQILGWCREFRVQGPVLDQRQYRRQCR
jgi:V8-like Glu-specific endopeptidase